MKQLQLLTFGILALILLGGCVNVYNFYDTKEYPSKCTSSNCFYWEDYEEYYPLNFSIHCETRIYEYGNSTRCYQRGQQ